MKRKVSTFLLIRPKTHSNLKFQHTENNYLKIHNLFFWNTMENGTQICNLLFFVILRGVNGKRALSSSSPHKIPATCQKKKICRHKLTYIEWWPVPSHPNPVIFIKIHSSWYGGEHEGSVRIRRRQKNHYFIDYRSISVNKLGWMVASSGCCTILWVNLLFLPRLPGVCAHIDRDKFHNFRTLMEFSARHRNWLFWHFIN